MENKMISCKEREALQMIFEDVDKFVELHNGEGFNELTKALITATPAERVHTLMFMNSVREFMDSISIIKGLLKVSEESFVNSITEGGKKSLELVENKLMISILSDIFAK